MAKASLEQVKQLLELLTGVSRDDVQKLIGGWDLVKMIIQTDPQAVDREAFRELLQANPWADEVCESSYGYPHAYSIKPVVEQVEILSGFYPDLDFSHAAELAESWDQLPEGAELLQVAPKLSVVGNQHQIETPFYVGYGQCLEIVLGHLGSSREFHNYREGRLGPEYLRLRQTTREALEQLEQETPGDCLVLPIQSGMLYRGSSIRRARWIIEHTSQWPAPSWVVGHHILTHPERLSTGDKLWINCPGDEYDSDAAGRFGDALCFGFADGQLRFDCCWVDDAFAAYGSCSVFSRE